MTDLLEARLTAALAHHDGSTRLAAALAVGSSPAPGLIDTLLARCAVEPDFYVRDMLTWALTRFPSDIVVPLLIAELGSEVAQARSQALHSLSKIKDLTAWPAITQSLLRDSDDEVAKSAWRAAVVLVPEAQKKGLAKELAAQLGRGNREVQLSLSRSLVALGEAVLEPVLERAMQSEDPVVLAHANATDRLMRDPEAGFQLGVDQVKRMLAPGNKEKG
jgi:HEAT repeat protein